MNRNQLYLLVILLLSQTLTSCKKEEVNPTFKKYSIEDSYYPLSIDNLWEYKGKTNYSIQVKTKTSKKSQQYFVLKNSSLNPSVNAYVRKENGAVFQVVDTVKWIETLVLDESKKIGYSWNFNTIVINDDKTVSHLNYDYSMYQKLNKIVVNGNVYDDVLVVDVDFTEKKNNNVVKAIYDTRYYYAKKVGLVKINTVEGSYDVASYSIK